MKESPLRILQVTQYCLAGSTGGTERYIAELCRELAGRGHRCAVAWLAGEAGPEEAVEGIPVHPLPAPPMRVDPPPRDLCKAVPSLLDRFRPHLLHFHTFGRSEAWIARAAERYRRPYVFTYHSPAWTCRRGDLLAWGGTEACDGRVRTLRCSACKVHQRLRGPRALGYLLAAGACLPAVLLGPLPRSRWRRRTAFPADTFLFRRALRRFLREAAAIMACAEWSAPVLVRNGARPATIRSCPQGVPGEPASLPLDPPGKEERGFSVGYAGRITPAKGVEILVEGFRKLRDPDVELHIFGWPEPFPGDGFPRRLEARTRGDGRIHLHPRFPPERMAEAYRRMDLLCIPSVTLETGPLVLLEALHHGVPVYGTRRVGQLHLLEERGRVVDPNTPGRWHRVLEETMQEFREGRYAARRLRARGAGRLRTMEDVAEETARAYREVLEGAEPPTHGHP